MTTFLLGISYANIQAETSLPHPVLVSIMRGGVLLELLLYLKLEVLKQGFGI